MYNKGYKRPNLEYLLKDFAKDQEQTVFCILLGFVVSITCFISGLYIIIDGRVSLQTDADQQYE
jgi:hypothetical protein